MTRLDSRTWLVWGVSCMVPMLVSRHPVIVLTLLIVVLAVRLVCFSQHRAQWRWIIRIATVMGAIGAVFNVLTVRSGNQVLTRLPLLDWPVTWNAIAYGLVSGLAMVTLVLTGVTMAAGLDWIALTRVLPARLAPLAVSGSVAWAFLPGAGQALTDIREAQSARGHAIRSARDAVPLVVPLIDGGLSRALAMAEALEARGFGAAPVQAPSTDRLRQWSMIGLVLGVLFAAFALAGAHTVMLGASVLLILAALPLALRDGQPMFRPTRYRQHRLTTPDVVVMVSSLISLLTFLVIWQTRYDLTVFSPYPNLRIEPTHPAILLGLGLLLAPAAFPRSGDAA